MKSGEDVIEMVGWLLVRILALFCIYELVGILINKNIHYLI